MRIWTLNFLRADIYKPDKIEINGPWPKLKAKNKKSTQENYR